MTGRATARVVRVARGIDKTHRALWANHAERLQELAVQVQDPTLREPLLKLAAEAKARSREEHPEPPLHPCPRCGKAMMWDDAAISLRCACGVFSPPPPGALGAVEPWREPGPGDTFAAEADELMSRLVLGPTVAECGNCHALYIAATWDGLELVGTIDDRDEGGELLEQRSCICGSTVTREL